MINLFLFDFRMEIDGSTVEECRNLLRNRLDHWCPIKTSNQTNRKWNLWCKHLKTEGFVGESSAVITFFLLSCEAHIIQSRYCEMDANVSSRFWMDVLEQQYDFQLDDLMNNETIQKLCNEDILEVRTYCLTYLLKRVSVEQLDVIVDSLTEAGESYYNQELYEDSFKIFCTIMSCAESLQLNRQWELIENSTNTLTLMVYNVQRIPTNYLLQLFNFTSNTLAKLQPQRTPDLHLSNNAFHSRVISNVIILMWCCSHIIKQNLFNHSQLIDRSEYLDSILDEKTKEQLLTCVQLLVDSCANWNCFGDGIMHALFKGLHDCYERAEDLLFTTSSALSITELYIQAGGDPNAKNEIGDNPLLVLCQTTHDCNIDSNVEQIVELLLQHGAHCDVTNNNGDSVMSCDVPKSIQAILKKHLPISLLCLSAQSLAKMSDVDQLEHVIPIKIVEFIKLHGEHH